MNQRNVNNLTMPDGLPNMKFYLTNKKYILRDYLNKTKTLLKTLENHESYFPKKVYSQLFTKANEMLKYNERIDNLIDVMTAYYIKFKNSISNFFKITFYSFYFFQIFIILISVSIALLILADVRRNGCLFKLLAHINWFLSWINIALIIFFLFGLYFLGHVGVAAGEGIYYLNKQFDYKCFNHTYSTNKTLYAFGEKLLEQDKNNALTNISNNANVLAIDERKTFSNPVELINFYISNFVSLHIHNKEEYLDQETMLLDLKKYLIFTEDVQNAIIWNKKEYKSKVVAAFSDFQRLISYKTRFRFQVYLQCPIETQLQVEFSQKNCDVPLETEVFDSSRHDIDKNKFCFLINNVPPETLMTSLKPYKLDKCKKKLIGKNNEILEEWELINVIESKYKILYDFFTNYTDFSKHFGKKIINK